LSAEPPITDRGEAITFANVRWRFVASAESIAVGFEAIGVADVCTH
jgi:hypothetical protein